MSGATTRPAGFPHEMAGPDFLGYMLQHFRVYHKDDSPEEAQWTRAMLAVLRPYEGETLALAALDIIRTRKEVRFPLPAEIIRICEEIVNDRKRPAILAAEQHAWKSNPWSRGRVKFVVEQLLSGEMGKRAARDGWIGALFDECRVTNKLPSHGDVWKLQDSSRKFQETRVMCHAGAGWPSTLAGIEMAASCARLGDTIEKRNRLLASVVLGTSSVELLFTNLDQFNEDEAIA